MLRMWCRFIENNKDWTVSSEIEINQIAIKEHLLLLNKIKSVTVIVIM